jgi:hypothetical protein
MDKSSRKSAKLLFTQKYMLNMEIAFCYLTKYKPFKNIFWIRVWILLFSGASLNFMVCWTRHWEIGDPVPVTNVIFLCNIPNGNFIIFGQYNWRFYPGQIYTVRLTNPNFITKLWTQSNRKIASITKFMDPC